MNDFDRLTYECGICQIHVNRLELAINRTQHLYPFNANILEKVSEEELGFLEIFSTRFSKLQDALGEKVFSLLLKCLGEDIERKSFIDKLNKLEKLELIPSAEWWKNLRELRNILTHEYPDDPDFIAATLNEAILETKKLIEFWQKLEKYILLNIKS